MPVWWAILAYTVVVSFFGTVIYNYGKDTSPETGVDSVQAENKKRINIFFAFATFALLVFFVGQRNNIFDTYQYQYAYNHYYTDDISQLREFNYWGFFNYFSGEKGQGYTFLLILFKSLTHGTANDWFTFVAIMEIIPIVLLFYKHSVDFSFSSYLFITSGCVLWMVNGMRQFMAAAFILYFADWMLNKKTIPFFIMVLLAATIHNTALLWIPAYFFVHMKAWSKKFVISSFLFTIALILLVRSSFFNDSSYGYATENGLQGVNPLRVLFMSATSVIAFCFRKELKQKTNERVDIFINLSVLTTGMYIIGMFSSGVVGRLPVYFELYNYALLPWLLKNILDEATQKIARTIVIIIFFAFFYYNMVIAGNGIYRSSNLGLLFV